MAKAKSPKQKDSTRQFQDHNGTPILSSKPTFDPISGPLIQQLITLPSDLWQYVLQCHCSFPPTAFQTVMLNLIHNPNLTSSSLFRADIFYDSETDRLFNSSVSSEHETSPPWNATNGSSKWLKEEYRPIWPKAEDWPGWELRRVMVRGLVPRNVVRDREIVQTCCWLFKADVQEGGMEHCLVLLIPHVGTEEDMPFYHPKVKVLGFLHSWQDEESSPLSSRRDGEEDQDGQPPQPGTLTLLTLPFPTSSSLSDDHSKLYRTALILLRTLHKHAHGLSSGYTKRVHHDLILPQRRYQNTYTRLKTKYGRKMSEQWVEVTDPGKHVFEDLGIASWLIEVWREMYLLPDGVDSGDGEDDGKAKPPFPGFVDIGCGNGLLVYILLSEGYPGWGFDARERKTWSIFPPSIRCHLEQRVLVPKILQGGRLSTPEIWHDGYFSPGTFIISNHADELTAWTPLLGYLNGSAWMAVPCCSHDLGGRRFRAPARTRGMVAREKRGGQSSAVSDIGGRRELDGDEEEVDEDDGTEEVRLPQQQQQLNLPSPPVSDLEQKPNHGTTDLHTTQAAETGSLARPAAQGTNKPKKMPSAYSTLCSYVSSLASEVGYIPKEDVLRIPSTRNSCVLGRKRRVEGEKVEFLAESVRERREEEIREIVEREMKMSVEDVGREWIARVEGLSVKGSGGH